MHEFCTPNTTVDGCLLDNGGFKQLAFLHSLALVATNTH
jgi:hypothetical protein